MLPELSKLRQYKHTHVIDSYVRSFSVSQHQAKDLFEDMLLYLWISTKHTLDQQAQPENEQLQFRFVMHQEMRPIDDMWHNFILYTRDYTAFCHQYFGGYVHHQPDIALNQIPTESEFRVNMEKYLSYIYEQLGETILMRWFATYFNLREISNVA